MDKRIRRYYKRTLYGGRTLFARIVDFVALRAIALAACKLYFSSVLENSLLAWIMAVSAVGAGCAAVELYKAARLEKSIASQRGELKCRALKEKLLALPRQDYIALIREHVRTHQESFSSDCVIYPLQQKAPLSEDAVLTACRAAMRRSSRSVRIFSLSECGDFPLAPIKRLTGVDVALVNVPEMVKDNEAFASTDADADAMVLDMLESEREKRKKAVAEPFKALRARRYVLVAAGLFAMSFFVKYTLYYRLLAAVCVSFSLIAWLYGSFAQRSKVK